MTPTAADSKAEPAFISFRCFYLRTALERAMKVEDEGLELNSDGEGEYEGDDCDGEGELDVDDPESEE